MLQKRPENEIARGSLTSCCRCHELCRQRGALIYSDVQKHFKDVPNAKGSKITLKLATFILICENVCSISFRKNNLR